MSMSLFDRFKKKKRCTAIVLSCAPRLAPVKQLVCKWLTSCGGENGGSNHSRGNVCNVQIIHSSHQHVEQTPVKVVCQCDTFANWWLLPQSILLVAPNTKFTFKREGIPSVCYVCYSQVTGINNMFLSNRLPSLLLSNQIIFYFCYFIDSHLST